jgi:uncharacterized lipoprotein YbaY
MRLPSTGILTCGGLIAGMALAGCAAEDTASTSPTGSATASASPSVAAATVADCVVGDWRTTALPADTEVGVANADVTGGAGAAVTIGPQGATTIDFTGMQPIAFSARVAEAAVTGRFTYAGTARGTMTTDAAISSASPAASGTVGAAPSESAAVAATGTWQPVGDINWEGVRFTLDLTAPLQARPFDDVPLGQYTGGEANSTGNVVDVDPFFDAGRYTCQGDTLTVSPDDDGDLPLVLQRA